MTKKENIKPVVLMIGGNAVGKTTLAQCILGRSVVGDEDLDNSWSLGSIAEYITDNMTIYDSLTVNVDKGEDFFIDELNSFRNENTNVNIFWYVIDGSGGRVKESDIKIINTLPKGSTLVVISKSDTANTEQLDAITHTLIDSSINANKILIVDEEGNGIDELKKQTNKILPKSKTNSTKEKTTKGKTTAKKKTSTSAKKTAAEKSKTAPQKEKVRDKKDNAQVVANTDKIIATPIGEDVGKIMFYVGVGLVGVGILYGMSKIIEKIKD